MTLRVFLDANVLFSAAYRADSGLRQLWKNKSLQLATSHYALEEARRNLTHPQQLADLQALSRSVIIVPESRESADQPREAHGLPDKDAPVLWSAIDADADFLLTGDKQHFDHLFGTMIKHTRIITPRMFFDLHPEIGR